MELVDVCCRQLTLLKDGNVLPPIDNLMRQLLEISNSENPPCANCDKRDRSNMHYCNTCGANTFHNNIYVFSYLLFVSVCLVRFVLFCYYFFILGTSNYYFILNRITPRRECSLQQSYLASPSRRYLIAKTL